MGADYFDRKTGQFQMDATLMSRVAESWEAEEIDQASFEALCQALMQRK